MSEQTVEQTIPEGTVPTQLQISDLLLVAQIIQLASQRGAFKTEEFTQVGGCYDRIVTFLKESGAISPAPETTGEPATDAPAPEAE
jgi:hypothetical protein